MTSFIGYYQVGNLYKKTRRLETGFSKSYEKCNCRCSVPVKQNLLLQEIKKCSEKCYFGFNDLIFYSFEDKKTYVHRIRLDCLIFVKSESELAIKRLKDND